MGSSSGSLGRSRDSVAAEGVERKEKCRQLGTGGLLLCRGGFGLGVSVGLMVAGSAYRVVQRRLQGGLEERGTRGVPVLVVVVLVLGLGLSVSRSVPAISPVPRS
jgi:hypothetical protein